MDKSSHVVQSQVLCPMPLTADNILLIVICVSNVIVYCCWHGTSKQLYTEQFCPTVSIYVCVSTRSTHAANLPAALN